MSRFHAIIAAAVLLASNLATWWLTSSHYDAKAIRLGVAHRVRWADGGSEVIWHECETKGVWR